MASIEVEGLDEFVGALKAIDRGLPTMVRLVRNEAADLVISRARPEVVRRTGRAAGTLRARSTRRRTRITGGGSRGPYYAWLDFGGAVGINRSVRRPYRRQGRYVYRWYFQARDSGEIEEIMRRGLVRVATTAGFEVS